MDATESAKRASNQPQQDSTSAFVGMAKGDAFAPAGGLLYAAVSGVSGYLVGRALGSPWTVAAASALFGLVGMAASTAYVVHTKGR